MHDCQRFREELTASADAVLPAANLPDCIGCRQYATELAVLFAQMENVRAEAAQMPAAYWGEFNHRLEQSLIAEGMRPRGSAPSGSIPRLLGIALASAAAPDSAPTRVP